MDFNAKDDLIAYLIEEIAKEITDVSLREIELNYDGVQWKDVVDAAIYRCLHFLTTNRKGFKDALILADLSNRLKSACHAKELQNFCFLWRRPSR
jgi:hypothetical protein